MKKVIILLVLAFVIPFVIFSCNGDSEKDVINNENIETSEPAPKVLYDETVKINAGSYAQYYFYVFNYGTPCRIEIKSDLDINVWLISGDEINHFANNEIFDYYPSVSRKKVISFNNDFVLNTGGYYVILDNKSSWFTPKNVSIKLIIWVKNGI